MGRQIAIFLSEKKEKEFFDFLLTTGEIVFIFHKSKFKKLNISNKWPEKKQIDFYIWNRKFKFQPKSTRISKKYSTKNAKFSFISLGKPVIEFSKNKDVDFNKIKNFNDGSMGRIYWEKYFTTSKLNYDVKEFEKWYNKVVRWIKKNCQYKKGVYVG